MASLVAIIDEGDVGGEAVDELDLGNGEGRSRTRHDILHAALAQTDHVGLAFDKQGLALLAHGALRQVDAVEFVGLVVDFGVGRVDILHAHAMGAGVEDAAREAHYLAAHGDPGEDDTAGKAIGQRAVGALIAEARLEEDVFLESLALGSIGHGVATGEAEAQAKLADGVVAETALAEVLESDGLTIRVVEEGVLEVFGRPLVGQEEGVALRGLATLLVGQFAVVDLDMVAVGQPAQGLGIGLLLMLHDEVDGIARLATGEAFIDSLRRTDGERRRLVVVERTQSRIARAALAERHKLGDDIDDVGRIHDPVYRSPVYHTLSLRMS